jgi:serine/threonine protein kinase
VSLVRSRIDGQTYAVKRKEGGGGDGGSLTTKEEKTLREVWAMAALVNVPHVVRYYGAWCEDKQLFIQMEACDCNIKSRYLGKEPTAAVLLRIIDQIGSALAGMHDAGLGHLDVKPENIYCSGQDFRLGDFGLVCSQKMVQEGVEPDEGDGRYASPEAIQGFSQLEVKELAPCDVYSLGASVLELALGRELSMRDADYVRIRAGEPVVLKDVSRLGKALSCILSEMLQPSAAFRTDCREVVTQARAALAADDSGAAQEVGLSVSGGDVEMAGCVEGGGGPSSGLEGEIRELKRRLEMREKENKELEEDLQAERSRNAHLEKHLEGLNASVSSQRSDAEPQGSQESPVRCFAQVCVCCVCSLLRAGSASSIALLVCPVAYHSFNAALSSLTVPTPCRSHSPCQTSRPFRH